MASEQIEKWNQRYREGHDDLRIPLPFFVDALEGVAPATALDLACGTGRHALWLAARGWHVTAVDGSEVAIERLRDVHPHVDARVTDLEADGYCIEPGRYDLIVETFFLHRPLLPRIASVLRPGGLGIFAFHATGRFGITLAELEYEFAGWTVKHGLAHHDPPTVELVVVKPSIPSTIR